MLRKPLLTASACLVTAAMAAPSSGSLVFEDGLLGTQGTGIDNSSSFEITVDDTTLTLATTVVGDIFNITATGTGIEGGAANLGDNIFNTEAGEVFTLSFDNDGTLDSIEIQTLALQSTPDTLSITFTNITAATAPVVQNLSISGGAESNVSVPVDLLFSSGDLITVEITNGPSVDSDFRLESVTATIPEPGTMVLSALGVGLMLFRRR